MTAFFKNRIERLQEKLKKIKTTAFVIENPVDLLYLTGLQLSAGVLFITSSSACLFVDGRYSEIAKRGPVSSKLTSEEARFDFLKNERIDTLIFDSAYTSYERFLEWEAYVQKGRKLFSFSLELKHQKYLLRDIRLLKDEKEQQKLRASAKLLYKGFLHIKKKLKAGITEKELADAFEIFCKKSGMDRLAFSSIIAFGENSAFPHHHPGNRKLKKGDIVLLDIGVVLDHYHSDMTRILFFGKKNPLLQHIYRVVQEAQKKALELCRPGSTCGELDQAARAVMKKEKMEAFFLHSLGHGIGLETHEFPRIRALGEDKDVVLLPGMVITVEPGLYMSGVGGVRLETTVFITENGHENLFPGNLKI